MSDSTALGPQQRTARKGATAHPQRLAEARTTHLLLALGATLQRPQQPWDA